MYMDRRLIVERQVVFFCEIKTQEGFRLIRKLCDRESSLVNFYNILHKNDSSIVKDIVKCIRFSEEIQSFLNAVCFFDK